MKRPDDNGGHRPFAALKNILDQKSVTDRKRNISEDKDPAGAQQARIQRFLQTERAAGCDNQTLFSMAMADVTPIRSCRSKFMAKKKQASQQHSISPDAPANSHLQQLINNGKGFMVCHTPEYMEGHGYNINPAIPSRLQRGDFSIQGFIDLHGFSAAEARVAFDQFIAESIKKGRRSLLIIHGRGLSSAGQPVLKAKVFEWLTTGNWRKWVIAFTSAREVDGGAGATYVLLRNRPATKKMRKNSGKQSKIEFS